MNYSDFIELFCRRKHYSYSELEYMCWIIQKD